MPTLRPLALTIPLVTVSPMPKGLPMARTRSPTSAWVLSARVMAGRSLALISVVILTTLGETRFTTAEKLEASIGPRLTGEASRLISTAGLESVTLEAPTRPPAMAKSPRAAKAAARDLVGVDDVV